MTQDKANDIQNTPQGELILYQPDETVRLEVRLEDDTVWLTQAQMAELFQTTKNNVTIHIGNVYKEKELTQDSTSKESLLVRKEGNRQVIRKAKLYNLDVIISVGYRVKSLRGTEFRQWANKIIKDYLLRGYSVNYQLRQLADEIDAQQGKIPTIYTQHVGQQLQLDIDRHNAQYRPIRVEHFNRAHDRFLLVDDEVYHIGASLKDLGRRWFAFTLMHDLTAEELIKRMM